VDGVAGWESGAVWWQREYTDGADVEYEEQIIPLVVEHFRGTRRVLDIGCGEGQVARGLAAAGVEVVGLDPSGPQITAARARGGGPEYARANAERLPIADRSVDAVLACLAFEHVQDLSSAVQELARVLVPGGRLLLLVGHPLLQAPGSGWIDDKILDERYWRIGEYLREHSVVDEVAPGVAFEFVHRPVHVYVNTLAASGLFVEHMDEPAPPAALLDAIWGYPEADTIPRILVLHARLQPRDLGVSSGRRRGTW
jgi:SAM-dependent methyltransferase